MSWRLLLPAMAILACGCYESTPGGPSDMPIPVAPSQSTDRDNGGSTDSGTVSTEPVERHLAGVTLKIPASWEERPLASDVLLAEYRVKGTIAGPARLTMSSTGGGIEANLARWETQFRRGEHYPVPKRTTVEISGSEAHVIELHGTFQDGITSDFPKDGWCMLGVAIPTGPATFFMKFIGPRETVYAHAEEFHEVVKTARVELEK